MDKATQKRLITQPRSRLTKINIMEMMRKPESWSSLPVESRRRLYELLPQPKAGEDAHDADVHPLESTMKDYVESALLQWQSDLKDGRETRKFREHKVETTGDDMPLESSEESDYGDTNSTKR